MVPAADEELLQGGLPPSPACADDGRMSILSQDTVSSVVPKEANRVAHGLFQQPPALTGAKAASEDEMSGVFGLSQVQSSGSVGGVFGEGL